MFSSRDKDGWKDRAETAESITGLQQRRTWFGIAILITAGFAAYSNSFGGVFVLDDIDAIQNNTHIRILWPLSESMSLAMINGGETVSRRPLLSLSFALNYFLSGPQPWGYHLVNLAIHLAAGLLLFGIARRTLCLKPFRARVGDRSIGMALAVALIWTVHPLQTKCVTYIVQRAESLMGMLFLLTMYCSLRGFEASRSALTPTPDDEKENTAIPSHARLANVGQGTKYWYLAAVLACAVGMGVKEVMVAAPIIVFVYDGSFVSDSFRLAWRKRWRFYSALAATWSVFLLIQLAGLAGTSKDFTVRSPLAYALTQPGVVLYYLKLSVWPTPLLMDYNWPTAESFTAIFPAGCVVVFLLGVAIWGLYHRKWFGFLGAWFFLILAPSSSFAALSQNIEEHRMYLSLAAVVVFVVIAGDYFLHKLLSGTLSAYTQVAGIVLVMGAIILLTTQTILRNTDYHSEIALWSDNIEHRPDSWVAQMNLGNALFREGRFVKAIHHHQRALAIKPPRVDTGWAHYNLGNAFFANGQFDQAIFHFCEALKINPGLSQLHNNLGLALDRQGEKAKAADQFRQAIKLDPNLSIAHFNLGSALFEMGQSTEAITHFHEALSINARNWQAHLMLGKLYLKQKDQRELGIQHLQMAVQMQPFSKEAQEALRDVLKE